MWMQCLVIRVRKSLNVERVSVHGIGHCRSGELFSWSARLFLRRNGVNGDKTFSKCERNVQELVVNVLNILNNNNNNKMVFWAAGLLANRSIGIERWSPLTSTQAPTPTQNGRAHRRRWSGGRRSNGSTRDTFQVENWKELKRRNVIDGRLIHLLITSRTRLLFSFGIARSSSDWRRQRKFVLNIFEREVFRIYISLSKLRKCLSKLKWADEKCRLLCVCRNVRGFGSRNWRVARGDRGKVLSRWWEERPAPKSSSCSCATITPNVLHRMSTAASQHCLIIAFALLSKTLNVSRFLLPLHVDTYFDLLISRTKQRRRNGRRPANDHKLKRRWTLPTLEMCYISILV